MASKVGAQAPSAVLAALAACHAADLAAFLAAALRGFSSEFSVFGCVESMAPLALRSAAAELALDLLTGDFPWNTFLMGRPFGRTILEQGVASMRLVSRDGEAVTEVSTRSAARPQCIAFKGGRAKLESA